MIRRMYPGALVCAGLALAFFGAGNPTGEARPAPKLGAIQEAGRFVCAWKPGSGEEAVKTIKNMGLKIVLRSDAGHFVACNAAPDLTQEKLDTLSKNPVIRFIEPDYRAQLAEDVARKETSSVDDETLKGYQKAGRVVCACQPGTLDAGVDKLKKLGLTVVTRSDAGSFLVCTWKEKITRETLETLVKQQWIRYIEPDGVASLDVSAVGPQPLLKKPGQGQVVVRPNDPGYGQLFGMENIRASAAWIKVQTSPVLVAVIDSGIDPTHEDLRSNLRIDLGLDFFVKDADGRPTKKPKDGLGHGTHVAGTIGAVGNNSTGVAGVCWRVEMVSLRVFGNKPGEGGFNSDVAAAIFAAVEMKARVVNLSLSGRKDETILKEAVNAAEKAKVLLVCAAGNKAKNDTELDNDKLPVFPANYPNANIISVAAIDKNNVLAGFSHFGKKTVHLAAPGVDVVSTLPGNKYGKDSGTSMATPHVAGAAALILGHPDHRGADFRKLKDLLLANSRKPAGLKGRVATAGTLDIAFLNTEAKQPPPGVKPPPPRIYTPPPNQCPQHPYRVYGNCH